MISSVMDSTTTDTCDDYTTMASFYKHGLTLIPAWISNAYAVKCCVKLQSNSQTSTVQRFDK